MTRILFPGRHHLLTQFQLQYLTLAISGDPAALRDVNSQPLQLTEPIDTVLWAVTSANHTGTRRNPLPAHQRVAAIEDFAAQLDALSLVFLIDDIPPTERFAEYVLKKIEADSQGTLRLTPHDTVVACSTPNVITLYERLGFRILPMELVERAGPTFRAETPWQLLRQLFESGRTDNWRKDEVFLTRVARASRRLYLNYHLGDAIRAAHQDPLLTDDGDLTETRDYNVYVRAFDEGAERKYELVRQYVLPGRVVDVGCCTGAFLACLARDERFAGSDLYGVEAARRLYAECLHRKEQGYFAIPNIFFYHANIASRPVFPHDYVHTFTTFSLTHELESYQGRAALERFIALLHEQLALGGRWLNVDVVGPENKDEIVYLLLNKEDGRNDDHAVAFDRPERQALKEYLAGLSTFGRFLRFREEFRKREGYRMVCDTVRLDGKEYVQVSMRDACEFLSKKDYLDNWQSEMHETFCFWSFTEWQRAVKAAGFVVHPDSRAFANPWIVRNRYEGKAELFRRVGNGLERMEYPVTTMVLIADKSLAASPGVTPLRCRSAG